MVTREMTIMIGDPVSPHVIVQAEHCGGAKLIFGPFDGEDTANERLLDVRELVDEVGNYAWSVVPLVDVLVRTSDDAEAES